VFAAETRVIFDPMILDVFINLSTWLRTIIVKRVFFQVTGCQLELVRNYFTVDVMIVERGEVKIKRLVWR
jgi:hypothetical protein